MYKNERFRLDVAQIRYSDREIVALKTVALVKEYFPEGIALAEIEGLLSDIRGKLASGMITYTSPLDMAQENDAMGQRYVNRINKLLGG